MGLVFVGTRNKTYAAVGMLQLRMPVILTKAHADGFGAIGKYDMLISASTFSHLTTSFKMLADMNNDTPMRGDYSKRGGLL